MKTITTILIAAACASQAMAQTNNAVSKSSTALPTRSAESYYLHGIASEKAGDPDAARSAYAQALKLNPGHANARYRMGELRIQAPAIAARGREAKFGAVMVPEFKVHEASLEECLQALELIVSKESKEEISPNFIIQDPKELLASTKITLNLKKVPASGVMRYLLHQASAKARFDEHAIVVMPK
jgi:tetratricopeptide (TPR) repeat protein